MLSRKKSERVFIGNNVVLTVVDIDRNKVRLGIEAPKDVMILRDELLKETPASRTEGGTEAGRLPESKEHPSRP